MRTVTRTLIATLLLTVPMIGTALAGPVNKTTLGGVAIKGYDPVAYFVDQAPTKGSKKIEFEWKGATWRFSSDANRQKFQSDPEKFAPQFGGYCAWAVSQGYTANIDPDAWTIHDDRLYLNYNLDVRKTWLEDRDNLIEVATKNWPELRDK